MTESKKLEFPELAAALRIADEGIPEETPGGGSQ